MRDAIPVPKCVGASLWRLATGECYCLCGLMVGLAKPTVVKCCHEFVQEICRLQDEFIKFPSTAAEIAKKIKGFDNKSKLPNVVGAIDGSHLPIKAPKINHEDYFNQKHFYSFLVHGMVDASGLYLSVATGFPGSLHDVRMLCLRWLNTVLAVCENMSFAKSWQEKGCSSQAETWQMKNRLMKDFD